MKFSIGYDDSELFFALLKKHINILESVYFPLHEDIASSGRKSKFTTDKKSYINKIIKLISFCNKYGIKTILILNSTCEGDKNSSIDSIENIIKFIKVFKNYGLKSISLTNLLYARPLKDEIKDIEIYSSVNCYLKTVEQAVYFRKLGVDVITIDRDINRNIDLINLIKRKSKLKVQVMLNEGCLRNCPFRNIHFNSISHNCKDNYLLENFSCGDFVKKNKRMFFRIPFIRPEELNKYSFVDYFKLTTRGKPIKDIDLMLNAYSRKKYDGNLLRLLDSGIYDVDDTIGYIDNSKLTKLNFFDNIIKCKEDCDICYNCDKYF